MIKFYSSLFLSFILLLGTQTAQAQQSKQDIKNHFQNGYAPGAAHFGYLIDACYNYSVGEGLIYDTANNLLKAEVPLSILEQNLRDTAQILRSQRDAKLKELSQQLINTQSNSSEAILDLEHRLNLQLSDTESSIKLSINQLDQDKTSQLEETALNIRKEINTLNSETNTKLDNEIILLKDKISSEDLEVLDTLRQDRKNFQNKLDFFNVELQDTKQILRTETENAINKLSAEVSDNKVNSTKAVVELEQKLNIQINRSDSLLRKDISTLAQDKTSQLADTAQNIRSKMYVLNSETNSKLNNEVILLNDRISGTESAVQDTAQHLRSDFQIKLNHLEEALQDTAQVIRTSLNTFYDALNQKIELGDNNLSDLISQTQISLINKIDSLAEVHNIDRVIQENRMTQIESDHSVLRDTVVKMKIKLDTLNFTEENFTQTLRLKLDNIEDGATRADNNFTDALKTKLDGIENNANNYQLPLGTHNKLGGIQLSQDFVLYNGKAYNALDASKIDREYAKDTITKNWTSEMKTDDEWTRIRYKMENGSVDGDGNKLYDYGEWNQAYKFIYDDLENSFYEFNATDSLNVILGIHEKDKFFTGKNNTLIGHEAGYTLYKGGERNVIIGKNAGRGSENVSDNVFIGNQAGESIGDPSQSASITGDFSSERNVALGTKAMQGRNASGKSVAIGYSAMELGEQNSSVAIGYQAANNNSGTNNIAIGCEAGLSVPGSNNTSTIAIGYRAGYKNTYARRNIFIGDSSALVNESGEKNIFIGHGTGKSNTGNGNLFLGNDIDLAGDDQLAIGNKGNILISGDFITNTVSIDKLSTSTLTVANTNSNNYSIANKEVINNSSQFVGEGGVNTSAQIQSTYANAKGNANVAISAPNGTVFGKYISGSDAILIGNTDVINNTGTFVGLGGVNTNGNIISNGAVSGNTLDVKSIKGSEALEIAGLSIVKLSGGIPVERYSLSGHNHNPAEINTNSTNRFVSDADKVNWNNKVTQVAGKGLSSNDYTSAEKTKLDGIETGANNYTHPASHAANMITQDANHRFTTDTEKNTWNNKVTQVAGKGLSSNDYTSTEKTKLNGIETSANNYTHPASHDANIITQDANHRFTTDTEKNTWNNKVTQAAGKGLSSNDYTSVEKSKLKGIETGANKYIHPGSHPANMITQDASHRFVSDTEKTIWNNKANKADLSTNDYTDAEKSKLAGIEAGANKYTHPATHSADMIVPTTNKQFVNDAEKASWNGKAEKNHTHTSDQVGGTIPLGGIIMWSGTTIPSGWALCNGQVINGITTPNLSDRFVVGSGAAYNTNDRGGNKSVQLKKENLPAHNHPAGSLKLNDSSLSDFVSSNNNTLTDHNNISKGVASKTISITGSTGDNISNNEPIDITPYYYALAFIMRVK